MKLNDLLDKSHTSEERALINRLIKDGEEDVAVYASLTEEEILTLPGVGKATLEHLRSMMAAKGLHFSMTKESMQAAGLVQLTPRQKDKIISKCFTCERPVGRKTNGLPNKCKHCDAPRTKGAIERADTYTRGVRDDA